MASETWFLQYMFARYIWLSYIAIKSGLSKYCVWLYNSATSIELFEIVFLCGTGRVLTYFWFSPTEDVFNERHWHQQERR